MGPSHGKKCTLIVSSASGPLMLISAAMARRCAVISAASFRVAWRVESMQKSIKCEGKRCGPAKAARGPGKHPASGIAALILKRPHLSGAEVLSMTQNFAAIILGGTGQVGRATVAQVLAIPQCREVVMITRKPIAPQARVRPVVLDTDAADF